MYNHMDRMLQVTGAPGITVKDPVHYCIHWDLRSANNKTLEWTARAPGKPVQTVRRWTPENEELNKYWDVPLRAIFTIWSNRHIVEWSGESWRHQEALHVCIPPLHLREHCQGCVSVQHLYWDAGIGSCQR
jgi:hypothetical protein